MNIVVCLAPSTCKLAQLPHPRNSHARITRETGDEFAPDTRPESAALSVRRNRELEGRARHAVCRRQGKVAQVWHVGHVHGHPARAANGV
jgi:hypothetical protein